MSELKDLESEYFSLMMRQEINANDLDYSILERHTPFLEKLAEVGNSAVTVFDLSRFTHVFASYNFASLFGYDMDEVTTGGNEYFNSRVHPDDHVDLLRTGIRLFRFFFSIPKADRPNYKAINEYRILNQSNEYVRVIEQHQSLELDKNGNVWLSLGVIDVSPNQQQDSGVISRIVNFKTGEIVSPNTGSSEQATNLTKREKEVLSLIRDGKLSKEISNDLSISVHTVNTHRQRILKKLQANNSMEAVRYADDLGLLNGYRPV